MRQPDPAVEDVPVAAQAPLEARAPSARAIVARRALIGAGLLGVAADPLLRNGMWGLGLLVWMLAFAVVATTVARRSGIALSRESRIWLAAAVLFASGLSWRDADVLHFFDVLGMLASLVLLNMSMSGIPAPDLASARVRDLIRAAFGSGVDVATAVFPLVVRDAELATELRPSTEGNVRRIGKALIITAPLLLVFALLLIQADPVFGSLITLPQVDLGIVVSHVVIAGFFAWMVAGWLRRSLLSPRDSAPTPDIPLPITLGATDVALALGALNVLFAAFVAVQIGWLFGGEALVLRTTGLGYAAYARRGFFELTCVACLLLPVLLGARALIATSDSRTLRLFRRLALPLVLLLGAVMASAGARMKLYVHFYGISTDRLYATAFMIWLAIVFVWLSITVLRSRPRLFAAGVMLSGFSVLFALNALNPDAFVARANLARGGSGHTGATGTDLRYVAWLGGDAIPLLVSTLMEPAIVANSADLHDRCVAARLVLTRWTGGRRLRMTSSWTEWNLARTRAMEAVRDYQPQLQRLACPDAPGAAPSFSPR